MSDGVLYSRPGVNCLLKTMAELLEEGKFTDVLILVEDKAFRAHKAVLYSNSPLLKDLLTTAEANAAASNEEGANGEDNEELLRKKKDLKTKLPTSPNPSASGSGANLPTKKPKMSVQVEKSASQMSLAVAEAGGSSLGQVPGNPPKPTKPKKLKCKGCGKKLIAGIEYKCRCKKIFCTRCRMPEDHGCTFDYKALGKEILAKANPVVEDAKIEKV